MPKVRVVSRDFVDLLANLPYEKLLRLYESQWTCQAVFRFLPPIAKMYVLRLLYVESAVPGKQIQDWILPDSISKHKVAIDKLEQLRVIEQVSERKKDASYKINPKFQAQFCKSLSSGGGPPGEPLSSTALRASSPSELDNYAIKQWEAVLLQLVSCASSEGSSEAHNPFIFQLFQRTGLITVKGSSSPRITEAGFQFLLMDTNSQLWQIVREYISAAENRGIDIVELIGFLLELGFYVVGEPYNLSTLNSLKLRVVEELSVLGLVRLQQGMKDRWFVPTKLAANLSSLSETSSRQTAEGFIVVETNFRVYAYTDSKLHAEILRLFARLEYQLPNLIVGALTKESVNTAFCSGITSEQMIAFLRQNAHPYVACKTPSIPETVCDQILLWEGDNNRIQYAPAYFYDDFPSMETYESVCSYARAQGGLLWQDASKKRLAVREDLHENVRNLLRQNSGSTSQRK